MPASSLYSMEIYTQRSICNSLSALARSLAYSHQSAIRSCTITDNLINPECPAMRTFVPARVVVYIIHIPMSANIYIPGCTTSFPECFDIFGLLPLVFRHVAFGKFLFNRLHSGFPFGGVTPVMHHTADFVCIGIMHLRIHKEIIPVERECDVNR